MRMKMADALIQLRRVLYFSPTVYLHSLPLVLLGDDTAFKLAKWIPTAQRYLAELHIKEEIKKKFFFATNIENIVLCYDGLTPCLLENLQQKIVELKYFSSKIIIIITYPETESLPLDRVATEFWGPKADVDSKLVELGTREKTSTFSKKGHAHDLTMLRWLKWICCFIMIWLYVTTVSTSSDRPSKNSLTTTFFLEPIFNLSTDRPRHNMKHRHRNVRRYRIKTYANPVTEKLSFPAVTNPTSLKTEEKSTNRLTLTTDTGHYIKGVTAEQAPSAPLEMRRPVTSTQINDGSVKFYMCPHAGSKLYKLPEPSSRCKEPPPLTDWCPQNLTLYARVSSIKQIAAYICLQKIDTLNFLLICLEMNLLKNRFRYNLPLWQIANKWLRTELVPVES